MKIIKPQVHYYGEVPTDYESAVRFIELCGRCCYKSEDKITDDSAEKFVKKLIKAGHLAMVEHSNFVVVRHADTYDVCAKAVIQAGKYLTVTGGDANDLYVGGNLTAWYKEYLEIDKLFNEIGEGNLSMFFPFIQAYGDLFGLDKSYTKRSQWKPCPHEEIPKELHRYSMKFICDRGVSHELVRHRPCSFAQESTRYVNYAGKEMEFVEPAGFDAFSPSSRFAFRQGCSGSEGLYKSAILSGLSPQQARAVLPNALKTEVVVTADAAEWAHIKKLRTHKSAHPDMVRIMNMVPWERMGV